MDCQPFQRNPDCTQCNQNAVQTAKEKGCEYRLENRSGGQVCQVKLDGCYLQDPTQRKCDFLFIACQSGDAYFVELKGKHIVEAVKQIAATIDQMADHIRDSKGRVFARIVATKINAPKLVEAAPQVKNLRRRLKQLGGNLEYKSTTCMDII
jgi:hypothetical protein